MTSKPVPKEPPLKRRRGRSFSVTLPGVWARMDEHTARAFLEQTLNELRSAQEATHISPRTGALTRQLLAQIFRQMAPHWDARVKLDNWQLVMVAAALVDRHGAKPKGAVLAAIQTFTPSRQNDSKFRATILRTYSKLRAGANPAAGMLLEPPDDIIGSAAANLPRKRPTETET